MHEGIKAVRRDIGDGVAEITNYSVGIAATIAIPSRGDHPVCKHAQRRPSRIPLYTFIMRTRPCEYAAKKRGYKRKYANEAAYCKLTQTLTHALTLQPALQVYRASDVL